MAYRVANQFPIDTKARKAVGVAVPFSQPWVFTSTYTTKDAIKSNLINYFLTNRNERVFNPSFGGNLRAFIFEQITNQTTDALKEQIQSDLQRYFSLIQIRNLEILAAEDYNTVQVILTYSVINFGIEDQINLTFTNGWEKRHKISK